MRHTTRLILIFFLTLGLTLAAAPAMAHRDDGHHSEDGQGKSGVGRHGGFHSSAVQHVTKAAQVASAYKDTPCDLTGHIINQVSYDRYTFQDDSGTVIVDISRKKFRGQTVTPETLVRLTGEVDYARDSMEVDVDYLEPVR